MDFGNELAAAWNAHSADSLVALFAPTCRYTDMPYRRNWEGHDGIRKLFEVTTEFHPDYHFRRKDGFHDGERFVWEWTVSGTFAGEEVTYGGISVGTLDGEGRIVENRDYWNPKDVPGLQ